MIDKLIHFALRNKFLIMAAVFILIAFGIYAFEKLPIDRLFQSRLGCLL